MQTILAKPRLLKEKEAAKVLGVKAQTLAVWRCLARYHLPFVKIGRNVRYLESDLLVWMESRKVRATEVSST
jgi:excisionase family DNA binding protein